VKNSFSTVKNKIISRYSSGNLEPVKRKSTNINVLLNRVRVDQKKEKIKKILFTASASLGLLIFGIFIF
tara:strand:- start:122 stop:328 length:207 start_codon:yes stop_codon:yes gene_type:complete